MNVECMTTQTSYPEIFPGFGLPLNHDCHSSSLNCHEGIFTGLTKGGWTYPMMTVHERRMLQVMNDITDKKNWFIQIKDGEIVNEWKKEINADSADKSKVELTERMIDWCFDELIHASQKVNDPEHPPPTFALNADVYKSDSALSEPFKQTLQKAMTDFEKRVQTTDYPPTTRTRHVVDPSLFPLVFGRSRVLPGPTVVSLDDCISRCGEGLVVAIPDPVETEDEEAITSDSWIDLATLPEYSARFQWLPCEVDISGERARITSYINNLHPREKNIYALIEEIIEASIPMWERTLSPICPQNMHHQRLGCFQRIAPDSLSYEIDMTDCLIFEDGPLPELGEKSYRAFLERYTQWQDEASILGIPEPNMDFAQVGELFAPPLDLRGQFKDKGLQVIVKMTDIHLSSAQPSFPGTLWELQGHLNEHIIATSVYFYSNENITVPHISFQHNVGTSEDELEPAIDLSGTSWLKRLFDCTANGPGIQYTGRVVAHEGRLLSFPNTIQEKIEPFSLEDRTRSGHCKMVVLFLVEPSSKILSTAKVPCQRKDWWEEATVQLKGKEINHESVDFPVGLEEGMELLREFEKEQEERDEQQREYFARECFELDYWQAF